MDQQQAFLLRMAGVNIYKVWDDTTQLSTRRGGSLMLRDAVEAVAQKYQLESISSGASEGLFEFRAAGLSAALYLRDEVVRFLAGDEGYPHLTFVVDVHQNPAAADFNTAKEATIARNRFRQFQQPTLALPGLNKDPDAGPCAWDNLRPMVNDGEWVKRLGAARQPNTSLSVALRHDYGRRQKKRDFILHETGLEVQVSDDLHKIAKAPEFGNLHNKLAVIYLDGNGFGKVQRECSSPNTLRDFDEQIRGLRREFLRKLVERAAEDEYFVDSDTNKDRALRLEILLWGGDEMAFIVPAWKGFETLQFFFRHSKGWEFTVKGNSGEPVVTHPLTHAAGLVFCQVKTPIQRMQALAEELANSVKAAPGGRTGNYFDYLALESIDIPGELPGRIRANRYGRSLDKAWRPLPALSDWENQTTAAVKLLTDLPRRQVFRIAEAATTGSEEFKKAIQALIGLRSEQRFQSWQNTLQTMFPGSTDRWQWLHLAELWDYLTPEQILEQESDGQVLQAAQRRGLT